MLHAGKLRFAQIFRNRAGDGLMNAEKNRAAADAIDAEREIKHRPKHGQKPNGSEPERRGAGVAFVEQRMNRGEHRRQKMKTRHQVRPEPVDCIEPLYRALILWRKSV